LPRQRKGSVKTTARMTKNWMKSPVAISAAGMREFTKDVI
jgi:hypothetical protein